jgi:single-stranded DNA-binding protein
VVSRTRSLQSVSIERKNGLKVAEGRLRTREREAKDKGQKRQRTEIVVARVHFLGAATVEHADTTEVEEAPILPLEDVPF